MGIQPAEIPAGRLCERGWRRPVGTHVGTSKVR